MSIRGRPLAAAVVVAALLASAPAPGAGLEEPIDVEVARDGVVTLKAGDDTIRRVLCLRLDVGASQHEGACGLDDATGVLLLASAGRSAGAPPRYLAVATALAATTVEVRRAGRLLLSAPTVPGDAYRGTRAGSVRFALLRLPAGMREDGLRVRALDGAGALVELLHNGDLVTNRRILLSGRTGPMSWRLASRRTLSPAPSVLDAERESISRCIVVTTTTARDVLPSEGTCVDGTPADTLTLAAAQAGAETRCDPDFRLVHGLLQAGVTAVDVVLGDGRAVAAGVAPVPGTSLVAYAVSVPASSAVRSVRVTRPGTPVRTLTAGAAPLPITCPRGIAVSGAAGSSSFSDLPADPPVIAPAGPVSTLAGLPPLRVADGPGGTLCIAPGSEPFTAFGCAIVSSNLGALSGVLDRFVAPRAFAVVVAARVATVRISREGGVPRDIATVPGAGYTGPYAGRVRFAAATISSYSELEHIVLLDGAGTVLRDGVNLDDSERVKAPATPARRLAGRPGHPSLWETSIAPLTPGDETRRCLTLTGGRAPGASDPCAAAVAPLIVLLRSSCASHRLTIAIKAPARSRIVARLTGGASRGVALRRGVGLLTLAPSSGVRAISIALRGRSSSVALRAPAGTRQCGWYAEREL